MASSSAPLAGTSASDLLRSSTSAFTGVPLRTLGNTGLVVKRRDLTVSAKLRLGRGRKKHEYPWSGNPDPNVKGGLLRHLSPFKPLKDKPKPVILEFEKPLLALQKAMQELQKEADESGVDLSAKMRQLEKKYEQTLRDIYAHLTPIQRVNIARHPHRPTFLDHVFNITEKFMELHGDRAGYDDPAIVAGLGTMDGKTYMFIGHQKGRNTKENIHRNFGMPTPHGYRKALRLMEYADRHGFPIVTFIDTPGAYADLKSEALGQGEAIAHNLRSMFGLKVPIVSIVIGEGGSGGALAIGCGNRLLMLENAVFFVASPEASASILWKTAKAAPKAAEKLKITAQELTRLQIADGVIPEPLGGAHADPDGTSQLIKNAINEAMGELSKLSTEDLLKDRAHKFRKLGGFMEDPKKNMKKDVPVATKISNAELQVDIAKLKKRILKGKQSSQPVDLDVMIKTLKREISEEFSKAVQAMDLTDELSKLKEVLSKTNSKHLGIDPLLMDNIENVKAKFYQRLSSAPNSIKLQKKRDMLKELYKLMLDRNKDGATLKQELVKKFDAVMESPRIKEKYEALVAEIQRVGASSPSDFDDELKNKIIEFDKELESQLVNAVKSEGLDVLKVLEGQYLQLKELMKEVKKEIETVANSSDIENKIQQLELEIAKAGKTPDVKSKKRINVLAQQIKQSIAEGIESSSLKEKYERLVSSISETSGELDGSFEKRDPSRDGLTNDELKEKVGTNRTFS